MTQVHVWTECNVIALCSDRLPTRETPANYALQRNPFSVGKNMIRFGCE